MNTFGKNFRVTTFGESHGKALGAVIDGCPSGINLSAEDIQHELDRRKPGQSAITTQRKEGDKAEILSGVFEDKTLGSPIAVVVFNQDQQSRDYTNIQELYRPGHADEMWDSKFGFRDYRGGGRSSGRETLSRVIGGAIAKKILPQDTQLIGHVVEAGGIEAENFDASEIEQNIVRCADKAAAEKMEQAILEARQNKTSLGGIIELKIIACPRNIGEPVFGKLQAKLADAMLSIGTVRSFEILPKDVHTMQGHESNPLNSGISGGMANGEEINIRIGFKPVPSISRHQEMKTRNGNTKEEIIEGRHDPCILPRAVPVVESMAAMVLADLYLENKMKQA